MSNGVYANSNEVSCKAGSGKSICAAPDVCSTPPQTPATPPGVPVPYPNSGSSSDCSDGTRSVAISQEEVMLRDKSFFRKSSGDEAGNAPKKNVITSTNRGEIYFCAWSMDVKFEGENAVRHLDLTTNNHASAPGATPPHPESEAASSGVVVIHCDKTWSDCQKKQARAKVDAMNKMCPLTRRPGVSKPDGLASSWRELGNAGAKAFKDLVKARVDGKTIKRDWLPAKSVPKGNASDLMHPCMEKQLAEKPDIVKDWSADHVQDLQFGGAWHGPLKMLDKNVNESLGRQMSNGPSVVTRFDLQGCD
ncbi:DUF4150 domain-containing protein [Caballeronia sp. GAWG1-5s-s]|uniref:DUF4150 domain-containing protein n=1 Tax=Caballeronia sp. GAWG1-5s-s TaxID=2921743 RepID=UPI0032ECCCD9